MLAWFLNWGEHIAFLEDMAASGGSPKALQVRPSLEPHLTIWWNAFQELCTDRPVHMGGVGAIPFTSLDRWARRHGLAGDDFEAFQAAMRAMDAAFRAHAEKQVRKPAQK